MAPQQRKIDPNTLVTIATFSELHEAHIFRTFLSEHHIQSFIADEHIVSANWLYTSAVGGVRVSVRHQDTTQAEGLVKEHHDMLQGDASPIDWASVDPSWAEDEPSLVQTPSKYTCSKCGCTQGYYEAFDRRMAILSVMLLGIPLPFLSRTWICDKCGHRWKNKLF